MSFCSTTITMLKLSTTNPMRSTPWWRKWSPREFPSMVSVFSPISYWKWTATTAAMETGITQGITTTTVTLIPVSSRPFHRTGTVLVKTSNDSLTLAWRWVRALASNPDPRRHRIYGLSTRVEQIWLFCAIMLSLHCSLSWAGLSLPLAFPACVYRSLYCKAKDNTQTISRPCACSWLSPVTAPNFHAPRLDQNSCYGHGNTWAFDNVSPGWCSVIYCRRSLVSVSTSFHHHQSFLPAGSDGPLG